MNKTISLLVMVILVFGYVMQPAVFGSNDKKEEREFKIPPGLSEISPGVFSLGKSKDVNGNEVEGIMFIHSKKEFAKPSGAGKPSGSSCYAFLTKGGVKWTAPETWVVNPSNSGLNPDFVLSNLALNIAKWEDASDGVIGNSLGADIMAGGSITNAILVADTSSPLDNVNEIYFANISSSGTIAVTTTWYNSFTKQIVEMDQVYDNADYVWSESGEPGEMDFENIAVHELGHGIGMGHPADSCSNETMYRYASLGETKKRDLNTGDIAGINALY
ncbi:MAG: matrixin family metalloprotease [Nitrosopumilaceae archaeon]